MPSIVRLVGSMIRNRRRSDAVPDVAEDLKLRFGEILAVSTIPDFAGLPLELWPGYRNRAATEEAKDVSRCAAHSRLVSWND